MMKALLGVLVSMSFVIGCGGGTGTRKDGGGAGGSNADPSGPCTPLLATNNMATCDARLGSAKYANATLAKTVPVQLSNTDYAATVGYVSRSTPTSDYTSFVIPVTNLGANTRCFVSILSGQAGPYDIFAYASGSVGYSGTIYTDTCLAPSQQGYLIDITNEVTFDQVSSISLTLGQDDGMTLSQAQVFPQSFTYQAATSTLTVVAHNAGALTVDVSGGFHQYALFDESGLGVDFGFLDATADVPLAAGANATLDDYFLFYGKSTRMVVIADFEGVGTTGALTVAPRPEDVAKLNAVSQYRERLRQSLRQR
jgi:hypothetical protein